LGFAAEFVRVNAWFNPQAQKALSVSKSESDAMLVGRIVGDLAAAAIGLMETADGVGIAGGGAIVGCGTTLCMASPVAVVAGGAIALQGVGTGVSAAIGIGQSVAMMGGNNSSSSWQVGDPINDPTTNGYPSWTTVKSRYWQNRAQNALPNEFSQANMDRMKQGLAPVDGFGNPMELHHINGRNIPDPHNINNLQEVWPWEHDDIDPFRHYKGPRPK